LEAQPFKHSGTTIPHKAIGRQKKIRMSFDAEGCQNRINRGRQVLTLIPETMHTRLGARNFNSLEIWRTKALARFPERIPIASSNVARQVSGSCFATEGSTRASQRSPAQIALAWLRQRPYPVIPILGARKLDQLSANLDIVHIELSNEHIQRLDGASKIELGFPHDFLDKPMVRSSASGGLRDQILA